ncbi:MAG: ATP synthase F0 subunit B [Treponema sp.]|nr:ATP synthase F0 subunit B [Treponema sp.]
MGDGGLMSPNAVTFVVTIINITILYFILRKILFKPVTKFMDARTKKIQDTIDKAEKDKCEAEQLLAKYNAQIKNAEEEAKVIILQAREKAKTEAEQTIAEGKIAVENMTANARRQLLEEQEAMFAKIKSETLVLVLAASSRLIGRELNSEDQRHYAKMMLDELSSGRAGIKRPV